MAELEARLRALEVEWPPTPDIAAAIRPRLEPVRRRRAVSWRAIAAAALVALLGSLAAIEPARSAILEFLGLKSVRIERRAPDPPPPGPDSDLDLGRRVTLAQARHEAGFNAVPPADLGAPDAVFVRDEMVNFLYQDGGGQLLVGELVATVEPYIEKSAGPNTTIDRISEDGARGYFLSGDPHGFAYARDRTDVRFEDQRLAGNTLLLERDGLLIRIEGEVSKERALEIARSVTATSAPPPG